MCVVLSISKPIIDISGNQDILWDKIDTISLKMKICKLISRNLYAREHDRNECICALPNKKNYYFQE